MVDLHSEANYPITGIYSFGRGLIARPAIRGDETAYHRMARLKAGQVVMSKLNAWEGALAVVDENFEGTYVSPEYPVFSVDTAHAYPGYLRYLLSWPELWNRLTPRGSMVRRKRTTPSTLLATGVPLPELPEQRRVADKLDAFTDKLNRATDVTPSREHATQLATSGLDRILARWTEGTTKVDQVCSLVNDTVHPGQDHGHAKEFVGLEHISPHFGRRIGSRPLGDEKGRKFRFAPGDVLYGYLRPYLNKVWHADQHGLCSVEQYVLRPNGQMPAELIAACLRSKSTLDKVIDATHNLQLPRLRSGLLLAMDIPFIPAEHHERAIADVQGFEKNARRLDELQQHRAELLTSLRPAFLNAAFSGQL
ncbi:type I restriction-modification enzyme, S subunit [Streptomyces glebosus]|uniref:Type I restriction-modification enzyme, S subunit n=2 Tax=Streptomyces glebosus TaxID=249580 RepID=A0A640T3W6_9ACTN|nr:type I restriction-modification enzyme, S subunit [Streptomyces glebosus]